jgi:serine/threonine-protein kinase
VASPFPDDDGLRAGRMLGAYELLAPVGSGGMAHVWAARDRRVHRIYALKMLREELAENVSFRQMFFDEARIASRIRHDNVCATYELVELDGILTLVMEWVDGPSLMHVLRPGLRGGGVAEDDLPRVPLPLRAAARIIAETCAGLQAAHDLVDDDRRSLDVVHRDVSPHNVLLTRGGRVKVTDFGVAKALGKLHMTIVGQVKGKLAYMSPEQLVGEAVDRRSDVFALGAVLYEVTTGARPFQGEHDPEVMSAIVLGDFPPPSVIAPGYPPELEQIVMRALSANPRARFGAAWELRDALERWLARTGPPLAPAQIAQLVHERCGRELAQRARALNVPAPAPVFAPATPRMAPRASAKPPLPTRATATPARGLGPLGAVLAILVGAAMGLAILLYVQARRRERAAFPVVPAVTDAPFPSTPAPTLPASVIDTVEDAATAAPMHTVDADVAPAIVEAPKTRKPVASAAPSPTPPPNPYD